MAPAKDASRAVPTLGAAGGCPIGALHEQRLTNIEQRLADHSDTLERIQGRLSQGDVSFAELRKDLEQLTQEVRGIKGILAWVGAAVGGGVLSAGGAALLWALRAAPAALAVVVLTGCISSRAEKVQTTTARQEVIVAPVELATPLGPVTSGPIRVETRTKQETTEKSHTETTVPAATTVVAAGAATSGLSLAGGFAGAAGLLTAVWSWLAKRRIERTLTQVVAGVEDAKDKLAPDQLARLLESLDSCMDSKAKAQVRDRRASL